MSSKNHWLYPLVLVLLLAVCLLPNGAQADEYSGDWQYALDEEGKAIITRYLGSQREVKLPWHLNGHMIVEIGEEAFAGNAKLRSITLPVGVYVIRMNAFINCTQLQEVILPERLETIEDGAFAGCTALAEINIPDSVAEIGEGCFDAATKLTGSEESLAWAYAKAADLAYEEDVLLKGNDADPLPLDYQYERWNEGVIITSYIGDDYEVIVPVQIDGYPVLAIGENAFSSRYSVEIVVLPEGLTTLARTSFRYCPALRSIQLPSTLKSIGESAFYRCENLEEIVIPASVTELGNRAFQGCLSLRHVTLSASLKTIPYYTFFECHRQLTIYAPAGSAAERFAYSKGYRFVNTK